MKPIVTKYQFDPDYFIIGNAYRITPKGITGLLRQISKNGLGFVYVNSNGKFGYIIISMDDLIANVCEIIPLIMREQSEPILIECKQLPEKEDTKDGK